MTVNFIHFALGRCRPFKAMGARGQGSSRAIGAELPELILSVAPARRGAPPGPRALRRLRRGLAARLGRADPPRAHADALNFAAQQTLDEARHHEVFRERLEKASAAASARADAEAAILIPPLRRFIDRCYEVADAGSFVEALVLMNLVLEGMAYPLYAYEERYWRRSILTSPRLCAARSPTRRATSRSARLGRERDPVGRSGAPREGVPRSAPTRAPRSARSSAITCASSSGLFDAVASAIKTCSRPPNWRPGGASPRRPTRSRSR